MGEGVADALSIWQWSNSLCAVCDPLTEVHTDYDLEELKCWIVLLVDLSGPPCIIIIIMQPAAHVLCMNS